MSTDSALLVRCEKHACREVWVICTHTDFILTARLVEQARAGEMGDPTGQRVTGEALCPACHALVEAKRSTEADLRLGCGGCVRERWLITGAS